MIKSHLLWFLLLPLVLLHVVFLERASIARKGVVTEVRRGGAVLPGKLVKVTTLEFDGVIADYFFLRGLTFVGSTFERPKGARVAKEEWEWFFDQLNLATDLDEMFLDPYYVGETFLAWDGREVKKANQLLEKGIKSRDWDWMLPFFVGFNYYHFLQDYEKATPYLMQAAKLPGASVLVQTLASRAAYQGNQTTMAILFLDEMIADSKDEITHKVLLRRKKDLLIVKEIENAISKFKGKIGQAPKSIEELVSRGFLIKNPVDPYGGTFYLTADGFVKTTSELK